MVIEHDNNGNTRLYSGDIAYFPYSLTADGLVKDISTVVSMKVIDVDVLQKTYASKYLSLCMRKPTIWVPTRSDTNWAVQSQKQARGLKFWLKVEEELYYPSSKEKGADRLCSYCTADLRLCFRLNILLVFSCSVSFKVSLVFYI